MKLMVFNDSANNFPTLFQYFSDEGLVKEEVFDTLINTVGESGIFYRETTLQKINF